MLLFNDMILKNVVTEIIEFKISSPYGIGKNVVETLK